jgi:hypothetical protein
MVGGLHTDSLNGERNTKITKKKIGSECNQTDPNQKLECQGREKELSNFMRDSHSVKVFLSYLSRLELPPVSISMMGK